MRRIAAAVLAASVLVLAGCTAAPAADPPANTASTITATSPTPTAAPTAAADIEAPTCQTLTTAEVVSNFQDLGWTSIQEPFMIGATEIQGGLTCKWGDPSGSGEGLQIFGWAPITDTQTDAAKAELLRNGWRTVDTDEGDFVTESLDTAFATGEQGYGLTYEFGDGWVTFADTKQSLLLIERPGS